MCSCQQISEVSYLKGLKKVEVCGASDVEVNKIGARERKAWPLLIYRLAREKLFSLVFSLVHLCSLAVTVVLCWYMLKVVTRL